MRGAPAAPVCVAAVLGAVLACAALALLAGGCLRASSADVDVHDLPPRGASASVHVPRALRVAVVGSGAGAAGVLAQLRSSVTPLTLVVYEAHPTQMGGRTRTMRASELLALGARVRACSSTSPSDALVEIGAGVLHTSNALVSQWARDAGMQLVAAGDMCTNRSALTSRAARGDAPQRVAVSDGMRTVLASPSHARDASPLVRAVHSVASMASSLVRFGPLALVRMRSAVAQAVSAFARAYELLMPPAGGGQRHAYRSAEALLDALELRELVSVPARAHLSGRVGLGDALIDEVAEVTTRVNYGSSIEHMNALAALVSLAGSTGSLFRVREGHEALVRHVVRSNADHVHMGARVHRVERAHCVSGEPHCWAVHVAGASVGAAASAASEAPFDFVVLALPLDQDSDDIFVDGAPLPRVPYTRTHTTFVVGRLCESCLSVSGVDVVLTTEDASRRAHLPFTSVAVVYDEVCEPAGARLFKVFSRAPLSDNAVQRYFGGDAQVLLRVPWLAYPELDARASLPRTELAPGVLHVNAFELAFSSVEGQAVAGTNVANIIANRAAEQVAQG